MSPAIPFRCRLPDRNAPLPPRQHGVIMRTVHARHGWLRWEVCQAIGTAAGNLVLFSFALQGVRRCRSCRYGYCTLSRSHGDLRTERRTPISAPGDGQDPQPAGTLSRGQTERPRAGVQSPKGRLNHLGLGTSHRAGQAVRRPRREGQDGHRRSSKGTRQGMRRPRRKGRQAPVIDAERPPASWEAPTPGAGH